MPPQGYVVLGGLAWNYGRSRRGKTTISQFARRHKAVTGVVIAGVNVWLIPHLFRRLDDAITAATNLLDLEES